MAVIEKYAQMFDEAEDEDILLETLGTPTKVAISLAGSYTPSPVGELSPETRPRRPSLWDEEKKETEEPAEEPAPLPETQNEEASESKEPVFLNTTSAEIPPNPEPFENPQDKKPQTQDLPDFFKEEPKTTEPRREYKPVLTTIYTILAVLIGLPITLALIAIGAPILLLGAGVVCAVAWCYFEFFAGSLGMVSDNLLCAGVALFICAIGALIAWCGLWISISLARFFISKCILRPGRAICIKKEAAGE